MQRASEQERVALFSRPEGIELPWWKRLMDILCALIVLPFLALATLAMTLVTKLLSPGPVFFHQERVGYRGNRFRIFKFRTMHVNHDAKQHDAYVKSLVDSNAPMEKPDKHLAKSLIPGGRVLRACGLDELPQIINILRGEMTVVGPRPCLPAEYDLYQSWQRERFDTVPGVTGLWQVSGKNRTTFEEMVRLDVEYVRRKSLWLDVKIVVLTVPALVTQISDSRLNPSSKTISRQTEVPFPKARDREPIKSR